MGRLTENSVVVMKNKSYAVTAQIEVPEDGARGVIVAQGGAFGGWTLYAKDGRPAHCYNLFGLQRFKIHGDDAIPPASIRSGWSSPMTAAAWARAERRRLYLDGSKVGEGRIDATVPMLFSGDETLDIGSDSGTPVSDDFGPAELAFNGRVRWIEIGLGDDARTRTI